MQLSKNFTLSEFLNSNNATRLGIKEQFAPPPEVVKNLTILCEKILQPLRDSLPNGFIRISSGYRCPRLNAAVKGQPTSQHLTGKAADVEYINGNGVMDNHWLFDQIEALGLDYDQRINEFGLSWVHLSYDAAKPKQRHQTVKIG
jgi:zinc D-Ala-D-Ala carboxypeptidase